MSEFKRIPLLIDAATGRQIDANGALIQAKDYFRLLFDETVILCCTWYDVDRSSGVAVLTARPVYADMTLAAFGDNDFNPETAFMFLTDQAANPEHVNAAGDWIGDGTASRTVGQSSFRINTNTNRFPLALAAAKASTKFYFVVTGVPAGETDKSVLAYFQFKAENRPSSSNGEPVIADPEYYTAAQTVALLKAAPGRQFSIDGSTLWHDTQVTADRYYRERRLEGAWSDPIGMVDNSSGLLADSFTNDDLAGGILTITHDMGDVVLPGMITNNNGTNETIDSKNITFSNNQILVDLNILSPLTGTWRYAFGGLPGAASTVPGPAGVQGVSTRHSLGDVGNIIAVDRTNGDYQVCTLTEGVTLLSIAFLATETGMILRINNGGGYYVIWGNAQIISATDTGSYACAFYNDNGTVCYMGKSAII